MLVVKVEVWPFGDKDQARQLGEARIALQSVTPDNHGSYSYTLNGPKKAGWRHGRVEGHHRTKRGIWDLLYRVLRHAVAERNA